MITIITRPYANLTKKILPVYNGITFVVDSNMKYAPGFRYIAEIYIKDSSGNGSKIGELRHNPDISNNNYGVFDVGRILEDYITYQLTWNSPGQNAVGNAFREYYVEFGEELPRALGVSNVTVFNPGGKTKIFTNLIHNGATALLIQGVSNAQYNGAFSTYAYDSSKTYYGLDKPYVSANWAGASITQGYKIKFDSSTYVAADGATYLKFKLAPSYNDFGIIGDTFTIYPQTLTTFNSYLNASSWRINNIVSSATEIWFYTNIPYTSTLTDDYLVFPQNKIVKRNLVNTKWDNASTFNGVFQYEDLLDYAPDQWLFKFNTPTREFLTRRPKEPINVCLSDYYTLSYFGNNEAVGLYNFYGLLVESYMKTNYGPYTTTGSTNKITNTLAGYTKYNGWTIIQLPTGQTGNSAGTFITVNGWTLSGSTWTATTFSARVIMEINLGGLIYIVTDKLYNALYKSDLTHQWTITQTQRVVIRSVDFNYTVNTLPTPVYGRFDIGAGPKNMLLNNYTEFSDVSKYFITPYGRRTSTIVSGVYHYFEKCGETWQFNIADCPCSKWTKYTLMWMNELGGWDYFNFTQRTDKKRKMARNGFRRTLKSLGTYVPGQKGQSTYSTISEESWILNTDWLSQSYIDYLQYIYESPEVYIIQTNYTNDFNTKDIIIPVNVLNEEVQLYNKVDRGDKGTLYQYSIEVQKANSREIQRGSNYGGNYFYNRA